MGNFISYYMNSTLVQQHLYDYIQVSDAENQTDLTHFSNYEKESEPELPLQIPKHYNFYVYIDSESQELKEKVESAVSKIAGVKSIYNEILVTKPVSIKEKVKSKTKDYGITTNVKARLFQEETKSNLSPIHIKVVTERQIVHLMGIVSDKEAEEAEKIAKTSKGVVKVKTYFEIDNQYKKN